MKKTHKSHQKMSTRSHHAGMREHDRVRELKAIRADLERREQQFADFEHRTRLIRQSLYSVGSSDQGRGWVEMKH